MNIQTKTTDVSAWRDFYRGREGDDYLEYVKKRYRPFIDAIDTHLEYDDTVVEQGCGTGTITKILMDWNRRQSYILADPDSEMLAVAGNRCPEAIRVQRYAHEPLGLVSPHIVHSHGVLEHLSDRMIRHVIWMNNAAKWQFHYVPGLYPAPSFGDERLMSVDQWNTICKPHEIVTFNDGLDYMLVFKRGGGQFVF